MPGQGDGELGVATAMARRADKRKLLSRGQGGYFEMETQKEGVGSLERG